MLNQFRMGLALVIGSICDGAIALLKAMNWPRLSTYLVARLNEPSSWASALALIATGGYHWLSVESSQMITGLGLILAGALKAALPDKWGGSA